jgi:hypothetical protein
MTPTVTEWEFTGDVVSWINEIIADSDGLPFKRAKTEQKQGAGSHKRRDISILDLNGNIAATGELKMPDQKGGTTPFAAAVVKDARGKAESANAPYFFTWNVNALVLWKTVVAPTAEAGTKSYRHFSVTNIKRSADANIPSVQQQVKQFLRSFLSELAAVIQGTSHVGFRSPDETFVFALETALELPIQHTTDALETRYSVSPNRNTLDKWMREDQGWIIHSDPAGIRENIERAAKFSCYSLLNKLVFYEALLKRYGSKLRKISVPSHITTGEDLRTHLEGFFAHARKVTGDYETVFGPVTSSIGSRIPFYSDGSVPHWAGLISSIHEFDFSQLDYEVIGGIFERLISPEERHKYGQFYTRVEIVDLINSFAIASGDAKVMDPACGGGTFLVRAYARKKELDPSRAHSELLTDLVGIDQSPFATHLTTINLATRDLIDSENYPLVARSDFFDVRANRTFLSLPRSIKATGLGEGQERRVTIPLLDAVVGNPPYVRQEELRKSTRGRRVPAKGTKEFYLQLVKEEANARLSGRSDLHCYFWPHSASFLKPDGYLCFLTSSQWLDVAYGFRLQEWILGAFEIVAVLESLDEPWFVGARVATTVTILRRQSDESKRAARAVRFVQFRRPLQELLAHDGTAAGAIAVADHLRDEILSTSSNFADDRYRIRLVSQASLWEEGVRLHELMKGKEGDNDEDDEEPASGAYYGGKWGVHLRAPDLWFELLDTFGQRLVPLGQIADVRFGMKTGNDSFFYVEDMSEEGLDAHASASEFAMEFGVARKDVASGKVRIVRCGKGGEEVKAVESAYLEPEVHSNKELADFVARPSASKQLVLLVNQSKASLKGTFVLEYIKWGEKIGVHEGSTIAARTTKDRGWYDLTDTDRPGIILPKIQQYRLPASLNPDGLIQNSSLLGVYDVPSALLLPLCGVLNSSIAILSRLIYARGLGNEGNIQLDVYLAKMMLVPDITAPGAGRAIERVAAAFSEMSKRPVMGFVSERRSRRDAYARKGREAELDGLSDLTEVDMADRRELDDAVLEFLGVSSQRKRDSMCAALYSFMREHFEAVRAKEERAITNKKVAKRTTATKPADIAQEIAAAIREHHMHLTRGYDEFLDLDRPFDTFEVPIEGVAHLDSSLFNPNGISFSIGKKRLAEISVKTEAQAPLLVLAANFGHRGFVRVPREGEEIERVLSTYESFVNDRDQQIAVMIEERTTDEELQERIRHLLRLQLLGAPV